MNILIVGNVIKDVYLSMDHRTEDFEEDRHGINWLNLGFNASSHHFFHRTSTFGGAAISHDILTKMGLSPSISDSTLALTDDGYTISTPPSLYRYILTSDDNATYLTPATFTSAKFIAPSTPPDYIFIDRSANINSTTAEHIRTYLSSYVNTGLAIHLRNLNNPALLSLIPEANLIFLDGTPDQLVATPTSIPLDHKKIVFISDDSLSCNSIIEPVTIDNLSKLTRLTAYSIASATILAAFLLGKSIEDSLRLARANLENSTLDSSLTLEELEDFTY